MESSDSGSSSSSSGCSCLTGRTPHVASGAVSKTAAVKGLGVQLPLLPLKVDESLASGTAEVRDSRTGKVLATFVNIGT